MNYGGYREKYIARYFGDQKPRVENIRANRVGYVEKAIRSKFGLPILRIEKVYTKILAFI